MGDILKSWFQARLGAMINLTPEVFGHYTRDGTLLAQILHSYDIINCDQLDTIVQTQDPALCRVNLKHLTFWLRFLGIDCDDESIAEISCGKGVTSLRLFYKLYLSLEGKDRLHFITLQKEREKFVPTSKKFEVTTVSENPPAYQPPDHPLCAKLAKGITKKQRFEFPSLLRQLRQKREKLEEPWKPYSIVQPVESSVDEARPPVHESRKKEESDELDRFARKHRVRPKKFDRFEEEERHLEEERERFGRELDELAEDPEAGKAYVEELKRRAKCAATTAALKTRMQKALLWQLLERMAGKQDRAFDEEIAKRTLDQSRYEKQIVSKLCEVREQKNAMAENQRIVENMTFKANELEHRANLELEKELGCKTQKDAEAECGRLCELRRRLFEEKVRRIQEKHERICREVVNDLLNLALNIGEYRRVNEGNVPVSLLCEWKTMFLRCQPIVDENFSSISRIEEEPEEEWGQTMEDWCAIVARSEARREALFDDYLEGNSPWDEGIPMLGEDELERFELGRLVLGYLVHRLLNALYPRPPDRGQALMSRFKTVAILLGIAGPELHRSIRALLEKSGIRLVRMEEAMDHCLQRYKEEMSDFEYIDANIILATNEAMRKNRGRNRSDRSGKSTEMSNEISSSLEGKGSRVQPEGTRTSSRSARRREEKESTTRDKETQTPRNIPFDDLHPVLTDAAYIGKWVYEFLTLGEPIDNELATKALVEYLRSVTDAKGWALIDYPNNYEQMCRLESALTGVAPPPDPKLLDFQDVTIEEIEPLPSRIVFENQEDPLALKRRSRLVPDPIANRDTGATRSTFVTLFVRIAQKPKNFDEDRMYEPVSKDAPSIDKFYASHRIAYALYYTSMDSTTLKRLARLVIGEPMHRKTSEELFGDALKELKVGTGQRMVLSKSPVVCRLLPETEAEAEILETLEDFNEDRLSIGTRDSARDYFRADWTFEPAPAKPGEPHWRWVDFPVPPGLLETLAKLWECLENAYIENAREMLYLKSVRMASIVPYREYVTRNTNEFIKRPDNKQDLLDDFHKAFNRIDPDARHDVDVKCELHRRVADFQATLWDICDERKQKAEEERRRLIEDHWAVLEASILYNVYVGIVQTELDRFLDTMRLIEDYYLGMLKKPLPNSNSAKVVLNRMEVEPGEPLRFEERPIAQQSYRTDVERTDRKRDRSGTKSKLVEVPPPAPDLNALRKRIDDALIDRNNWFQEAEECNAFQGILENARYARKLVDSLSTATDELIDKERVAASKLGKDLFGDSGDAIMAAKTASTGEELVLEWRYAVAFEVDRIRLKLDSVIAVARADFFFLLDTLQRTFYDIYNAIVDRYWRETKSVNEMSNVFCFAIEEGRMIENEMLLEDDTFVVRSNVFVVEVDLEKRESRVKEAASGWRFRIADLARLMEIFRKVAPYGTMSERAFVYILQDLISHACEEGESMLLPCVWYQLRASDVPKLISYLFETVDYIDWREFLVYAMELPWPTVQDLLIVRERFRRQDPDLRETITRAQYHRTSLWFHDCTLIDAEVCDLLHDDFQRTAEQLCEDELYRSSPEDDDSLIFSIKRNSMFDEPGSNPEETLRLNLGKELLCRMYAIDRHTLNYTALLLVFCKHDDPVEGFAKALAVALGNRVCINEFEGERYVEQAYEWKRLGLPWRHISCNEVLDVTKAILEQLLDRAIVMDYGEEWDGTKTISRETFATSTFSSKVEFEGEGSFTDSSSAKRSSMESVVYWIPLDLCLTVLAATLPWHVLQPEFIGKCVTLRERLSLIYEELRDEYLNEPKNVVLSHRLLNHGFMKRLLNSISNFTTKNIAEEIRNLLQAQQQT